MQTENSTTIIEDQQWQRVIENDSCFKIIAHALDKRHAKINNTSWERNRYFRLMDTRNCGWQAQGIQFILIRTAEASGLRGGERRSRLAVTAYPFLMEVYRLSSAEATVTITCHQEAWSLSACESVCACVCLYAWTYQFLFSLVCHFLLSIIHSGLLILH